MKPIRASICLFLILLFLTGCIGGKSVTLTQRVITEDEQRLIYSAGGVEALHFTSKDSLPKGSTIQFSIEQFEQGQAVGTLAETSWIGETEGLNPLIGFGVQTTEESPQDRVLFSGPSERLQPELEAMPGGSTLLPGFEEELKLKQGETAILAYYIVSTSGRVQVIQAMDEEGLAQLQSYDRCLLLKAQWID